MSKKQFSLIPHIVALETIGKSHGVSHRFVGGVSHAGLLEAGFQVTHIDVRSRHITYAPSGELLFRKASGTTRDIDIVVFCPDRTIELKIKREVKAYVQAAAPDLSVTIENACYGWLPLRIKNFLTVYAFLKEEAFLYHAPILIPIHQRSLEPWTITVGRDSYTVRNPIADWYAYQIRTSSGIKQKDRAKCDLLEDLCHEIITLGKAHGIDYTSHAYYAPWATFARTLLNHQAFDLRVKRRLVSWYWNSPIWRVFTDNTHPVGKVLLKGVHIFR